MAPDDARTAAAAVKRAVSNGSNPTAERKARERQAALDRRAAATDAEARMAMLERALQPQPEGGGRKAISIIDFTVLADAPLRDCAHAFGLHGAGGKAAHVDDTIRHLLRGLDEMHAADFRPAELKQTRVAALVDLHARAGRPATARHRLGALNRLFKWLMSVDAANANPTAAVVKPAPPRERSNVLSAAEVKALWDGAERLPSARGHYLRLALLLPLRRQELADLKVRDIIIDGDTTELRLEGAKVKNGRTFVMPIVGTAAVIVRDLVNRAAAPDAFLIPLSRSDTPFSTWKRFNGQVAKETGVALAWHDLRRTFATEMGEHAAAPFAVVDGLLNHAQAASKTGAARAYHHAVERQPKTAAMTAWDRIIAHAAAHCSWPRQAAASIVVSMPRTA